MIYTQPVCYEFQNIKVPTLLIIGTRDRTALGKPLVSEEVRKNNGIILHSRKKKHKENTNSKLVEIPNIGHMPYRKFDKFIEPLIAFG
jgi:pimeloyl-ACP methyl ester carboxylesterase